MYQQISDNVSINIWVYTIFLQDVMWAYVPLHLTAIYVTTKSYFL